MLVGCTEGNRSGGNIFQKFLEELQERDERQRREQQERDERQRREQQERDERQRKEYLHILRLTVHPDNPWAGMARSSSASNSSTQSKFRSSLAELYSNGKAKCFVTKMEDNSNAIRVVAAHIWPKAAAATFPLINLADGVNHPSNGMFLHKRIEKEFDLLHVCFLCNPFDISATFVVLHRDILQQELESTGRTFEQLHGTKVQFEFDKRPSFQLLSKHAQKAFSHPENNAWIEDEQMNEYMKVLQVGSPMKEL
jgi:hypothetical protein